MLLLNHISAKKANSGVQCIIDKHVKAAFKLCKAMFKERLYIQIPNRFDFPF